MSDTKICSKCKQELSKENFYPDKYRKDKLRVWCKECCKSNESFRWKNDENHRIKINLKRKQYQLTHKKQIAETGDKWRTNNPTRFWVNSTLQSHRRKGIIINITTDELLNIATKTTNCEICNVVLDFKRKGKINIKSSPSLDRKNNDNYINKDNILITCYQCNATKGSRTWKEFINYCYNVVIKFYKEEI